MNTKETAYRILDSLPDEKLQTFITLFGDSIMSDFLVLLKKMSFEDKLTVMDFAIQKAKKGA